MALEFTLKHHIDKLMQSYMFDDAVFMAERLVAEFPDDENQFILAKCYFSSGKVHRVIAILKDTRMSCGKYLLAKCYFQTGNLDLASGALLRDHGLDNPLEMEEKLFKDYTSVPGGYAGLYLLGCIAKKKGNVGHAEEYFRLALAANPFCWTAYEKLCALGSSYADPDDYFGDKKCFGDGNKQMAKDGSVTILQNKATSIEQRTLLENGMDTNVEQKLNENLVLSSRMQDTTDKKHNIRRSTRIALGAMMEPKLRTSRKAENISPDYPNSPISHAKLARLEKPSQTLEQKKEGLERAMELLGSFASALYQLSQYRSGNALSYLQRLPTCHFKSGWVQQQIGRAYFEMCNYNESKTVFERMRMLEPYRMEGLEIFSTVLWHLKQDVQMCALAHEIADKEILSCEVWCAIGNCFSRQKEHETALKFFKRAIQIDQSFTYAYTLCGHEYVVNEDFEKATSCYRQALATDQRHYNAWYGLGTIYYRQEKYDLADSHFRRALSINQYSSLLHCYLGMVLLSNKNYDDALDSLATATKLQPANPQARFQRANVLIHLQKYEEALCELTEVLKVAPLEGSVHFLMGKVCKRMGDTKSALAHFSDACYYNPKDTAMINMAIDHLHDPDMDEPSRL